MKFLKRDKENISKKYIEELLELIEQSKVEIEEYKMKLEKANEEIKLLKEQLDFKEELAIDIDEKKYEELSEGKEIGIDEEVSIQITEEANIGEEINEEVYEKIDSNINEGIVKGIDEEKEADEEISVQAIKEIDEEVNKELAIQIDAVIDESIDEELGEEVDGSEENNIIETLVLGKQELILKEVDALDVDSNKELMEELKNAYISNDNNLIEALLDKVLDKFDDIESDITKEDVICLMYIYYFNNSLDSLLNRSPSISEYYYSENNESKLLKMIQQEVEYKVYTTVKESTQAYIRKERDLFKMLDITLKMKIIKDIRKITYKTFEFVKKVSDIEYGNKTTNIKALVKECDSNSWKLVEALYSYKNEEIYLLESSICFLKVRVSESNSENSISTSRDNNEKIKFSTDNIYESKDNNVKKFNTEKSIDESEINNNVNEEKEESNKESKWSSLKSKFISRFSKDKEE